jgi:hypothetical protein
MYQDEVQVPLNGLHAATLEQDGSASKRSSGKYDQEAGELDHLGEANAEFWVSFNIAHNAVLTPSVTYYPGSSAAIPRRALS